MTAYPVHTLILNFQVIFHLLFSHEFSNGPENVERTIVSTSLFLNSALKAGLNCGFRIPYITGFKTHVKNTR